MKVKLSLPETSTEEFIDIEQLDDETKLKIKTYLENCLSRHFQAQVFLSQKAYKEVENLIKSQPELRAAFAK